MHRTLDRLPEFDPRSRLYNVAEVSPPTPRSYTWACYTNLDQGSEGACVGFAWTHEWAARPRPVSSVIATESFARGVYHSAQMVDEWDGEDYSGTSVIAGAKAMQDRGIIGEYRWAFNLMDALAGVSRHGPAVLGINWYEHMWETDHSGFIHPTGDYVGGHAILLRGVDVTWKRVLLHNSWGPQWGGTSKGPGTAWLSWDDLEMLMHEEGEVCIPVVRY